MTRADSNPTDFARLIRERDALRQQLLQLQALRNDSVPETADNAPFGIIVISAFKILYANRACLDMFGVTPGEPWQDVDPMSFLAPQEWEQAAQCIGHTSAEHLNTPLQLDTLGLRRDGTVFPMAMSVLALGGSPTPVLLCYVQNTTMEGHAASRYRSLARKRLRHDAAGIAGWDWNHDTGAVVMAATMLSRLALPMGLAPCHLGRHLLRAVHRQDRSALHRQIIAGARRGFLDSSPFRYTDAAGRIHFAVLHARQADASRMTGIVRDITELQSLACQLDQARIDAHDAAAAKRRFLGTIGHELRTPLNGILGMLELLEHEQNPETFRRFLSMATLSGRNLLQMITDILELAADEPHASCTRSERFAPQDLIATCCAGFRREAEDKGLELACSPGISPTAMYLGDARRLEQVLRNLLSNAIKFTPHGSVSIDATITSMGGRHRLLLCVSDTGIGIPDHKLSTVFEPFAQADETLHRAFQGAGVGLGLVKRSVARMGGTLSICSEEERGTTICCTFDLVPAAQERCPASSIRRAPRPRILLAEDNIVNQALAETVLQRLGYEVRPVRTGGEVLRALDEEEYGCVLMDIQMPEMSGLEATRRIRSSNRAYARIPIIALTAMSMQTDRDRLLASGMNGYLAKPFSCDELQKAVEAVIPGPETGES